MYFFFIFEDKLRLHLQESSHLSLDHSYFNSQQNYVKLGKRTSFILADFSPILYPCITSHTKYTASFIYQKSASINVFANTQIFLCSFCTMSVSLQNVSWYIFVIFFLFLTRKVRVESWLPGSCRPMQSVTNNRSRVWQVVS